MDVEAIRAARAMLGELVRSTGDAVANSNAAQAQQAMGVYRPLVAAMVATFQPPRMVADSVVRLQVTQLAHHWKILEALYGPKVEAPFEF